MTFPAKTPAPASDRPASETTLTVPPNPEPSPLAADRSEAAFRAFAARLAAGEGAAARELFAHYAGRLVALARRRLGPKLRAKEDPEDVLQSVMRTFFRRLDAGAVALHGPEGLWGFLTTMTLWKCGKRAAFHAAARRDAGREGGREDDADGADPLDWEAVASPAPSPDEVAALADLVERLLAGLGARDREAVELLLAGEAPAEAAARLGCSERTVYRTLERVRRRLLAEQAAP